MKASTGLLLFSGLVCCWFEATNAQIFQGPMTMPCMDMMPAFCKNNKNYCSHSRTTLAPLLQAVCPDTCGYCEKNQLKYKCQDIEMPHDVYYCCRLSKNRALKKKLCSPTEPASLEALKAQLHCRETCGLCDQAQATTQGPDILPGPSSFTGKKQISFGNSYDYDYYSESSFYSKSSFYSESSFYYSPSSFTGKTEKSYGSY